VSQAVEQLKEQRGNLSLRRTVSVDNVVTATSGYAVSTPCVTKRRGVRNHVKCAGHSFVVSVYFCTMPRWSCDTALWCFLATLLSFFRLRRTHTLHPHVDCTRKMSEREVKSRQVNLTHMARCC
jgi:hypothetical protein